MDYVEAGSFSEITLRANRDDLDAIRFRERVMFDVSNRKLQCRNQRRRALVPRDHSATATNKRIDRGHSRAVFRARRGAGGAGSHQRAGE